MTAEKERNWSVPALADGDHATIAPLLSIITGTNWTVETTVMMSGTRALRFKSAPKGRGVPRSTFVVVGSETSDYADLFAMLAGLLRDRCSA